MTRIDQEPPKGVPKQDQRLVAIRHLFGELEEILPYPTQRRSWNLTRPLHVSLDPSLKRTDLEVSGAEFSLLRAAPNLIIVRYAEKVPPHSRSAETIRTRFYNPFTKESIDYIVPKRPLGESAPLDEFNKVEFSKRFRQGDLIIGAALYRNGELNSAFYAEGMPKEEHFDYYRALNRNLNPQNKSSNVFYAYPGVTVDKESNTVEFNSHDVNQYYLDVPRRLEFQAGGRSFVVGDNGYLTAIRRLDTPLPWGIVFQNRVNMKAVHSASSGIMMSHSLPRIFNTQIST